MRYYPGSGRSCECGDCVSCRAYEQWRAEFRARTQLADKQARLHDTEVRAASRLRIC
jgi:hypothetical protein